MTLNDADDSGKAEAGALANFLGGEKRFENLVDDAGRNACAGIGDADKHIIDWPGSDVLAGFIDGERDVPGLDGQGAAVGHRIAGVDAEV